MNRGVLIFLVVVVLSSASWASIQVAEILTPRSVRLEGYRHWGLPKPGERLPVFSTAGKVIGFVEINHSQAMPKRRFWASAKVLFHSQNELIRVGDEVRRLDFSRGHEAVSGRHDIVMRGKKRSARYKPLVYQGPAIGQTAETLSQGEHLVDIVSFYAYGISEDLSASSILLGNVFGAPNASIKYNVVDNEWFRFSPAVGFVYFPSQKNFVFQATAYFDFPTNSKFVSHTSVSISADVGERQTVAFERAGFLNSSIQSGYAYIFDNWDRLLFGPKYNFERRGVGGYLAYLFVWDHLHVTLNLDVGNLTTFKIGSGGYLPHFALFWRF